MEALRAFAVRLMCNTYANYFGKTNKGFVHILL